jgi:enediyne biosynthesis protein E4
MKIRVGAYLVIMFLIITACSRQEDGMFRLVPAGKSGITFRNTLHEDVDFNSFNYMYFYNGGGVSVGDLNGDNLPDIYFTSNQEANALYLNQGDLHFRDITQISGVKGFDGWTTGVTMADVNSDGRLDLYVSNLGDYLIYKSKNQLFINEGNDANGIPLFRDRAMEFGLDLVGFSTQASFFDYDLDGDLDVFMLNHSVHENGTFGKSDLRSKSHPLAGDRLLRNDNGRFVDVTQGSGIYNSVLGYGLGVVVSDINMDGWPDIYVGNDFHENDYLYLNMKNGTFRDVLEQQMTHTSRYTMGVDFADFNNDAFPDLFSADMLPEDPIILKSSMAEDAYDVYNFKINFGFNHQFARNALQLNNQNGTFSEIALFAGVAATDWSWATLFADFNLDGHKDIFVANGISRRSNNLDYINFITLDSVQMKMKYDMTNKELAYISKMPQIKIPNYLFLNNGDSTFTNKAPACGMEQSSYSNGAAYADLDNDGDLDLVVNNIEDVAFVYENLLLPGEKSKDVSAPHYLKVRLKGRQDNAFGIGTKIFIYSGGKLQMQECMPTRGYQSSVDYDLVFGTGAEKNLDSVVAVWTDGSMEKMTKVSTGQTIIFKHENARGKFDYSIFHDSAPLFENATKTFPLSYKHAENRFVEFNREALIPHMMSAEGPGCATADINQDGKEDIFLGGAKWKRGHIFIQTPAGGFRELPQPILERDSTYEDVDAVFFDADNDSDPDLFVVSGGNEFSGKSNFKQPRLYLNDGKGNFTISGGLPQIYLTGSCAAVNDFDNDGDMDIFVGARTTTWRYGIKPDSFMLLNDGKGNFSDETQRVAPQLLEFGFVKAAQWTDIDNDRDADLVIAAEWSPISIFINDSGKLHPLSIEGSGLEKSHGWWNAVTAVDYDDDGDIDLIAGNLGLNSKLKTSVEEPVRMFVGDFDSNDSTDQILTHYMNGKEYPFHTRDEITKQMPYLKKRFLSYKKFAETDFHTMFSESLLKNSIQYSAYTFRSSVIENLGNLKFRLKPLPAAAQFSTVNAIVAEDVDNDNKIDLILAGNFFPVNIQMGRYDASFGLVLKGDGRGRFLALPAKRSGFSVTDEVRSVRRITVGKITYYVAVRNNNTIEAFSLAKQQ